MKIIGKTISIAQDENANVYQFISGKKYHAFRCFPEENEMIFSFFAKSLSGLTKLKVYLEGPHCSQSEIFMITEEWSEKNRYKLFISNSISLSPLNMFLELADDANAEANIAFAFFQMENSRHVTSPITHDVLLPCLPNKSSGNYDTIEQDIYEFKKDTICANSMSFSFFLVYTPDLSAIHVQKNKFYPYFSCYSTEHDFEVSVGFSGDHEGRYITRICKKNITKDYVSNITLVKEETFLCTIFNRNTVTVVINAHIALEFILDQEMSFDRSFLGCSLKNQGSCNSVIARFVSFNTPITYIRALQFYQQSCSLANQSTYNHMLRYFKYAITDDSEQHTFDECYQAEGFQKLLTDLNFIVPKIFENHPPQKHAMEEDIRNTAYLLLLNPASTVTREAYTQIGRSDLNLAYQKKNYPIEFKIWGRAGYNQAPSQPLKYMVPNEQCGVFIMIDRRKKGNMKSFKDIIQNNQDYSCYSIRDVPVLDENINHFISFHRHPNSRILKLMINVYLWIPG